EDAPRDATWVWILSTRADETGTTMHRRAGRCKRRGRPRATPRALARARVHRRAQGACPEVGALLHEVQHHMQGGNYGGDVTLTWQEMHLGGDARALQCGGEGLRTGWRRLRIAESVDQEERAGRRRHIV